MEIAELKAIVEGILFASGDEGIKVKRLSQILETTEVTIHHLLEELAYDYEHTHRGIMMIQSEGVYYLTTKPEHSLYYKKLLETPYTTRLSQAALETLAIIAYQQPITRVEIEDIRGVNSDRPVQTLQTRSLVEEVGRKEAVGRPVLFGTSKEFLTYFGLTSLEELPQLPDSVDKEAVEQEADLYLEQLNQMEDKNTGTAKH